MKLTENEKIQKIIDVNEISTVSNDSLAAVECSQSIAAINFQSEKRPKVKKPYIPTKDLWYQTYSLDESYAYRNHNNSKKSEKQEPPSIGEISAIESVCHVQGSHGLDTRPKVFDKSKKVWTGSCVSCIPKGPNDKIDPNFQLRAVNGAAIPTFGVEEFCIQIGRKQYSITAVKTDISQTILGWDFFRKYSLGFDWNEYGDLFLTDKKAKIRSLLKHERLPSESAPRIEILESYQEPIIQAPTPESVYFETNCMKNLCASADISSITIHPDQSDPMCDNLPLDPAIDPEANDSEKVNLEALKSISPNYAELIKKYPSILKATFKTEPAKGALI